MLGCARVVADETASDWRRYALFAAVGLFNTVFGYGLYLAFLWTGLPYWLAWGASLGIVLVVGFTLGGMVVFDRVHPSRFVLYCASWAAIYLLNLVLIDVLSGHGIRPELAPLVILPVNVVLSYLVQKKIVYRKTSVFRR